MYLNTASVCSEPLVHPSACFPRQRIMSVEGERRKADLSPSLPVNAERNRARCDLASVHWGAS